MGLRGKVRAYTAGWGEIMGPLLPWMKSNGLDQSGLETTLTADLAPSTHVHLIESHAESQWKLSIESWGPGGVLHQGPAEVIGRNTTPPILQRTAFVRACLRALEDFDEHFEGPADLAQVFQRIHEIRGSGLLN